MSTALSKRVFHRTSFKDRVIAITGGAHGIGKAAALQLTSLGACVIVLDSDLKELDKLGAQTANRADALIRVHGDVRRPVDLRQVVDTAADKWGRLDGWVNNAMASKHDPIHDMPPRHFTEVWQVNTLAGWQGIKLALGLLEQRGGSIVNISSVLAQRAAWTSAAYISSKAALEGLTRALAIELASKHIRVNAIAPGQINSSFGDVLENPGVPKKVFDEYRRLRRQIGEINGRMSNPWPRGGWPQDVANAIVFLLSDAAEFITGVLLPVDGGAAVQFSSPPPSDMEEYEKLRERLFELIDANPALPRRRRHRHRQRATPSLKKHRDKS